MPREPGFHRMVIARLNVNQVRGQERAYVRSDDIIQQRVTEHRGEHQEQQRRGERARGNAAESAEPERPTAPGRAPPSRLRRGGLGLLIQRARNARPQLWRQPRGELAPDGGAQTLEILEQGTAIATLLQMTLDLNGGQRIQFAVEVGLHAQ